MDFSTSSGFALSISGSLSDEEFDELVVLDDEDELDEEDVNEELEDDADDRRRLDEDEGVNTDLFSLKPPNKTFFDLFTYLFPKNSGN